MIQPGRTLLKSMRSSTGRRAVRTGAFLAAMLLMAPQAASASNDHYFSQQWGLQRVRAEAAWSVSRGAGVLIAVVDSGVYLGHEDLRNKIAPGMDFVDGGDPNDEQGHGTLVAGVAAAETGNGVGIAGVAPDARIMPIRVFDSNGNSDSDKVSAAISWTVDEAARRGSKLVLNLSFVGPATCRGTGGDIFAANDVQRAIVNAASRGAAVVAAAGNDGCATTQYDAPPGSGIIVVGAHTEAGQCASRSNYGPGLDILAPGSAMTTAGGAYGTASGTSIAVPFVSGAAAMLMSRGSSNREAINRILASARGPAISCSGEASSYQFLDIGAALGASLATATAAPQPAPQRAAPRQKAARPAPPARAPAPRPPVPAPPPLPEIVLPRPEPETIVLAEPAPQPVAGRVTEPEFDFLRGAAAAFALSAFILMAAGVMLRPRS